MAKRLAPCLGGLLYFLLLLPSVLASPEDGPGKAAPPRPSQPAPAGIHWEPDLAAGLERALREGRPVLIAVNALEDERANIELATRIYRSAAWGDASRGYVCLVGNPNQHEEVAGSCQRYPGTTCRGHRQVLQWVLERHGPELISPQHLILEPEADLDWRKEYYEPHKPEEVSPLNLETHLSRLAPALAYRRAQIGREQRIAALVAAPNETLGALATAWLGESDGLAAAGVIAALDESEVPARRLTLLRALADCPPAQAALIVHAAEERVLYPDDEPEETRLYVAALLKVDRQAGAWAASRVIARSSASELRRAIFALWAPGGTWKSLPRGEQVLAIEALLLGGEPIELAAEPEQASASERERLRRARARGGRTTAPTPLAADALASLAPGEVRRALLLASVADIQAAGEAVENLFLRAPYQRVRLAAALALLRARRAAPGLSEALIRGLADGVEGPEIRQEVEAILDLEPGQAPTYLADQIHARLGGAR